MSTPSVEWVMEKFACSQTVAEQALNAYKQYLSWESASNLKITDTEMQLVSEQHKFGGTPDAVGKDADGNDILIDWKSSKGIYTDYLIQLAAYAHLLDECMGIKVKSVHCIRFDKETADFEHRRFQGIENAWRQFLLFREAYEIDKVLKKRVR